MPSFNRLRHKGRATNRAELFWQRFNIAQLQLNKTIYQLMQENCKQYRNYTHKEPVFEIYEEGNNCEETSVFSGYAYHGE